ncbi:putative nuclear transport factor 2 [Bimuria novae-zelandiae CBS 107.79]|uniref:Nuclear transport factor 2 n=1 Tax=Bimuria novae-zelandiae CBS 107.79 TaxID=1447943 RepID=A0A6A5UVH4_9PLEO|nr:putative nuclear transport factor 2 [Bimuria novae-zelandiae CBS 107.79]
MGDFQAIAEQFVDFYYKTFDENRPALKALYRPHSMLTFEQQPVQGADGIVEKLTNLPFNQVVHKVATKDAQPSAEDGIIVMVTGALQVDGQEQPMSYTQTFQLKNAGAAEGWYVLNDIFRLVYPAA